MKGKTILAISLGTLGAAAASGVGVMAVAMATKPADEAFSGGVYGQGRRTVVSYLPSHGNTFESQKQTWDMSVMNVVPTSNEMMRPVTPSLLKDEVLQTSKAHYQPDGKLVVDKEKKTKVKFDLIKSMRMSTADGSSPASAYIDNWDSASSTIKSGNYNKIEIKVDDNTYYVNSKGEKTNYKFKSKDLFYGLLRLLLTNKNLRLPKPDKDSNKVEKVSSYGITLVKKDGTTGALSGLDDGKGNFYKGITQEYLHKLEKSGWYENGQAIDEADTPNIYLLGSWLYDLDIPATIKANFKSPDAFVIISKNKITPLLFRGVFTSTNFTMPIPSEKLIHDSGLSTLEDFIAEPGKFIQLDEFSGFNKWHDGVADLSQELTVARYFYENMSYKENTKGIVLRRNKYSYDKEFNAIKNSLEKIIYLPYDKGDLDSQRQNWAKAFLNPTNSASVLYKDVMKDASIVNRIKEKELYQVTSTPIQGMIKGLTWNPMFMLKSKDFGISDGMSQLLFGKKKADAYTDPNADNEYFFGRGKRMRALINNSVNLFSYFRELAPGANDTKTSAFWNNGQLAKTGQTIGDIGRKGAFSYGASTPSEQMSAYQDSQSHPNSTWKEAYVPVGTSDADTFKANVTREFKNLVKEAETQIGGKLEEISMPLYDLFPSDKQIPQTTITAQKHLIEYLNDLAGPAGIKFTPFTDTDGHADSKNYGVSQRSGTNSPLFRFGLSPDYPGVLSYLQQIFTAYYGYGNALALVESAIRNEQKSNNGKYSVVINKVENNNPNYVAQDYSNQANQQEIDLTSWIKTLDAELPSGWKSTILKSTLEDYNNFKAQNDSNLNQERKAIFDIAQNIDAASMTYLFNIAVNGGSTEDAAIEAFNSIVVDMNLGISYSYGTTSAAYAMKTNLSVAASDGSTRPYGYSFTQPWMHIADNTNLQGMDFGQRNWTDTRVDLS